MESGRKPAGSSSSFSSDLFGVKGSYSSSTKANSSSSTGIFDSVFSPISTIPGRDYSRSEVSGSWRKQDFEPQVSNPRHGSSGKSSPKSEGENRMNNSRNSIFQDQTVEPCYLSSSLYYGGQDIYSNQSNTRVSEPPRIFKKDGDEDDSNGNNLNSASRGNWWQESLYY